MCGGSHWHNDHLDRRQQVRAARPGDLAVLVPDEAQLGDPILLEVTSDEDSRGRPVFRAIGTLPCSGIALVIQRLSVGVPNKGGMDKLLVTCNQRVGWVDWVDVERVIPAGG